MSASDRTNGGPYADALDEHVATCAECAIDPVALDRMRTVLRSEPIRIDASLLSHRVAAMVAPELARLGARAFRRRVAIGVLLALLPLPIVLAYDALLLRAAHAVLSFLLPEALVLYLVAGMGLTALLLIATSYAAIPLLVHRQIAASRTSTA